MNKRFVIGLMAALAIGGCQVREEGGFAPEGKVFTATMEAIVDDATDVATKTSMDQGGNVLWKRGDQVSIFVGSTINQHFRVTDESDGKTSAALNPVESSGFVAGEEISNNVAFYPYAATAEIAKSGSSYIISEIALPVNQAYSEDSFGSGSFPMVAVTSSKYDYNLKFKNVIGGLKLQLKGTATIASISITGNNGELLSGDAEVTVSSAGIPSITLTGANGTTATLDCGDGVQLDENNATAFIIALPPMTMSGGFTAIVTDTEGATMEIKTTRSQTITRSNLLAMPALTYVGTAPETTPVPEAVDLGLPSGIKWASFNLGASAPEEYGDYFAWGETAPYYTAGHSQDSPCSSWEANKTGYNWASYQWCNGSANALTKYRGYDKTQLDPEDDAAHDNWGGNWRMPTNTEWTELKTKCTWTATTQGGVNGYLVTSKTNSNSIFLPAAGRRFDSFLIDAGAGYYWSSSLYVSSPSLAKTLSFTSSCSMGEQERYFGQSVRPVLDDVIHVTDVTLDSDSLFLVEGETASLTATVIPSNATQPAVMWSSSNTAIATVDYRGIVTAAASGTATITATTYDGGHIATCSVTVCSLIPSGTINGYGYVDLGLTSGLKWASFNLGANATEEYGDYFAWGATATRSWYYWDTCPFCDGGESEEVQIFKYNTLSRFGPIDNTTVLDPEDDAAAVNWGGTWRMPTDAEWKELITECTWTWTTCNDVYGRLVTSNTNGNSIFLPAAGRRIKDKLNYAGSYGNYWSSSLDPASPRNAKYVNFGSSGFDRSGSVRCHGLSVRPVTE